MFVLNEGCLMLPVKSHNTEIPSGDPYCFPSASNKNTSNFTTLTLSGRHVHRQILMRISSSSGEYLEGFSSVLFRAFGFGVSFSSGFTADLESCRSEEHTSELQ